MTRTNNARALEASETDAVAGACGCADVPRDKSIWGRPVGLNAGNGPPLRRFWDLPFGLKWLQR